MAVEQQPATSTTFKWVATLVVVIPIAVIAILSWQLHWHWLPNLWFNYAWPSDKGNGPEALQQTIIYAAIAVLLIPPIRKAIERFAKRHVESIKNHIVAENKAIHEKLDRHEKLQHHIILNSRSIPNEVPGIAAKHQPKQ
jgi:hypothetical protein